MTPNSSQTKILSQYVDNHGRIVTHWAVPHWTGTPNECGGMSAPWSSPEMAREYLREQILLDFPGWADRCPAHSVVYPCAS